MRLGEKERGEGVVTPMRLMIENFISCAVFEISPILEIKTSQEAIENRPVSTRLNPNKSLVLNQLETVRCNHSPKCIFYGKWGCLFVKT